MSTPAACLLLGRFVPAAARLYAEFQRLRRSLPPAEAQKLAGMDMGMLRHADMLAAVRLRAHAHEQSAFGCAGLRSTDAQRPSRSGGAGLLAWLSGH